MFNYDNEEWVGLYTDALTELEHAKMRGRIGDARAGIMARMEKLKNLPGLYADEHQAIQDGLNALRFLEREEDRYDEIERLRALETACLNLQCFHPRIRKMSDSASE